MSKFFKHYQPRVKIVSSSSQERWTCHACGWYQNPVGAGGFAGDKCAHTDKYGHLDCKHPRCFKVIDYPDKNKACETHWKCHLCKDRAGTSNGTQVCQTPRCAHLRCNLSLVTDQAPPCTLYYFRCHECGCTNHKGATAWSPNHCGGCGHLECESSYPECQFICTKALAEEASRQHDGPGQHGGPSGQSGGSAISWRTRP